VAVAALAVAGTAEAAPDREGVEAYRDGDAAVTALNILTPGQGRRATLAEVLQGTVPAHNDDQRQRYDALVQGAGTLTPSGLRDFFKDASFGVRPGDVERVYSPRPGVVVIRDRSAGVPHVYGATRADVAFGAGYVHAEDRLFDADVNRHIGRGRLSELLGATPANLAVDRFVRLNADYTEDELQGQLDRLVAEHGALGAPGPPRHTCSIVPSRSAQMTSGLSSVMARV
jgi:Penicillin amidase